MNLLAVIGCIAGAILAVKYFVGSRNFFLFPLIILFWVSTFVIGLMFIARTIGVVMMVAFPEKQAFDVSIDGEKIVVQLEKGALVTHLLKDVNRILLMETSRSVLIHSITGTQVYRLSMALSYKQTEAKIDAINQPPIFKKERQFLETHARDVDLYKNTEGVNRTTRVGHRVYEIDPAHAKEVIAYTRI